MSARIEGAVDGVGEGAGVNWGTIRPHHAFMQVERVGQPIRADLVPFRRPIDGIPLLIQCHQPREDKLRFVIIHAEVDQRRVQCRQVTGVGADLQRMEDLSGIRQLGIWCGLWEGPGHRATAEQRRTQQRERRKEAMNPAHHPTLQAP
jgi:hypothetical protein